MEPFKGYQAELEIGSSIESLQKVLESQKALFHSQIGHLQNIVVTQCKLTGVNPLSQEMAAGALFVKIGKRRRDLLNPKAVNYLQSVFSIKDAVTKKEIRDISARFSMTATQVKEYFTNQRSRVRRLVRLSREKAVRNGCSMDIQDGAPISIEMPIDPLPLCTIAPPKSEETPSCSNQHEVLPDVADSDKNFIENIFSLMRKEDTFSGQVKLMEWILKIKNPSLLCWFLTRGGLMILATWLSQAASEEQTSVLYVVLKVLSYLPLNKALPVHMSAIIQSVNTLRFYGKTDVSSRARALLSCWSKMFGKSQATKRLNGIKPSIDSHIEIDLKQRICELMGDELDEHPGDMSEDARYGSVDETRRLESPQAVKLLTASTDDSNKRLAFGIPTHKERRKVLLVEQPGQKTPGKNQQVVKAVPATHARPITADEIQKAKMRAQFMQSKHSKAGPSSKDSDKSKSSDAKRPSSLLTNDLLSASEAYLRPKLEAHMKSKSLPQKNTKQHQIEASDQKQTSGSEKNSAEGSKKVQIPWQMPPEIKMDLSWKVCSGEKSKEAEVQRNRIIREKESVYPTRDDVPSNPKEPWDVEMDYDDSLTPEIPVEQLPETEAEPETSEVAGVAAASATTQPDLELLAVLLKNPELVFALTSGQASGLSNHDTVRLLDLLKNNNSGVLNGTSSSSSHSQEMRVEVSLPSPTPMQNIEFSLPSPTPASRFDVSLPSPTPATNVAPSGWPQETMQNPFSRHSSALQRRNPASETPVVPCSIEQLPCTLQQPSSSWANSDAAAMTRERPNPTLNPIQPTSHHHQQMPPSQFSGHNFASSSFHAQHLQGRSVNPEWNQRGVWAGRGAENSPSRHQEQPPHGRSYREQAGNPGRAWRHDLPGFRDQSSWNGGRRWGNQDRRK